MLVAFPVKSNDNLDTLGAEHCHVDAHCIGTRSILKAISRHTEPADIRYQAK